MTINDNAVNDNYMTINNKNMFSLYSLPASRSFGIGGLLNK